MLFSSHQLNDKFQPKDKITEHTLNIRLVHCGKHSHESSLVSKKSSLISKKLTALYGKPKIKVNANTPYTEINSSLGDSKVCLQLNETDALINPSCGYRDLCRDHVFFHWVFIATLVVLTAASLNPFTFAIDDVYGVLFRKLRQGVFFLLLIRASFQSYNDVKTAKLSRLFFRQCSRRQARQLCPDNSPLPLHWLPVMPPQERLR